MPSDSTDEQLKLWYDFIKNINHKNRSKVHHELLDRLKSIVEKYPITIEKDSVLYRARINSGDSDILEVYNNTGNEDQIIRRFQDLEKLINIREIEEQSKTEVIGYDEKRRFAPTDENKVKAGSANPSKIRYLYVADQDAAALAEVRPFVNDYISIAEIIVLDKLHIADLTRDLFTKIDQSDEMLFYLIMKEYAKPNNNETTEYLTTQVLSEFIKSIGFDGIKYSSSSNSRGKSYVIFGYEKCKTTSSKLYQLKDICYEARNIGPYPFRTGDDIYHWKLQAKEKEQTVNYLPNIRNIRISLPANSNQKSYSRWKQYKEQFMRQVARRRNNFNPN